MKFTKYFKAPLFVLFAVIGLAGSSLAQAEADEARSNGKLAVVSTPTHVDGCDAGLMLVDSAYKCKSLVPISQGGTAPDPTPVYDLAALDAWLSALLGNYSGGGGYMDVGCRGGSGACNPMYYESLNENNDNSGEGNGGGN